MYVNVFLFGTMIADCKGAEGVEAVSHGGGGSREAEQGSQFVRCHDDRRWKGPRRFTVNLVVSERTQLDCVLIELRQLQYFNGRGQRK